ncbi:non-ribosomal peptide synthetase [Okeania sp. KiyG1]|uniref:non-ribosomal peptide synthetase n=1 Tax=Okeania sp. KiyG1 TaxID=2720165 RepID=UPI001921915B|nr:non-ribosomal peptide synthetase [Okeania sp. KiyG1]GGA11459.1 hypothetical protein CYANOKiyG1_24370 [Okeania sp. KiyG1]GGA18597.1 hypothetical protein CYANOKiyG1_33120 [Okeania sp. KiyG1]
MKTEQIEGFCLSPQQKNLWLLQQKNPSSYYRTQGAFLIKGALEKERLTKALQNTVKLQEILRTTFYQLPEMDVPLQVIGDNDLISLEQYDLQQISSLKQLEKLETIFQSMLQQPFNLQKSPILQLSWVQLSPDELILIISLPGLCSDRFSLHHLMTEISNTYAKMERDEEDNEPFQYVDFSEWQNELLNGEETEEGRDYWQQEKLLFNTSLKLPLSSSNNKKLTTNFDTNLLFLNLDDEVNQKIKKVAHQYNISLQDFFLSCFLILLGRMTNQSEVSLELGSDNRQYEELGQSIGLMTKYLPLSTTLDSSLNFATFCQEISQKSQELAKWQDYFTPQIAEFVGNGISFETDLQINKTITVAGISWSLFKEFSCLQAHKLNVCCVQYSNQLEIEFHYNVNCFEVEVIEGWLKHYHILLINAAENPTQRIEDLDILGDEEKEQILFQFNSSLSSDSLANTFHRNCVHHLIETQAQQNPQQIAVVGEGQTLTYHQLNARANQLARHLQKLGVQPDDRVGICVGRSPLMIVGLLGILKAGGAYVPLDPVLPQERLKFMLEDSQAEILITKDYLTSIIPAYLGKIVVLERDREAIVQQSETNINTDVRPQNLAYAIYTSGSTGTPKGVAIEHRQLLNYIQGITPRLNLPSGANYALISTFAADLGNTVIFPALCGGGSLHIISQEHTTDPTALGDYFAKQGGIDCLKIVPSHLRALMTEITNPVQILPKKCLVLGGETTPWELVEQVQKFTPNCQIINHYGPTEATVGVLIYKVTQASQNIGAATVPLGRPLPNTQIFLLDKQLRPVPVGFPGELYIGGDNLARGYLNQSSLKQDRFQTNPFNQKLSVKVKNHKLKLKITRGQWFNREAKFKIKTKELESLEPKKRKFSFSERLYRTGDLARYLPDGNIEFLGRIDNQVKLHGFRIELGEIETRLNNHPSVRETVVLLSEKNTEYKRLVAYVVPRVRPAPKVSELRHYLQETLPEFMIPSRFVFLNRFPLNPNGKLDRRKLLDAETTDPRLETSYIAPKTHQEKILAKIWADVLNVEQVGIEDNFFELGGDSILSIQIVARAKAAGLGFKPIQLFQHSTITDLLKVIQTVEFKPQAGETRGQVPLTPIQHWFFEQSLPNPHHWNMSILLETPPQLQQEHLETAIQHLIEHHDTLRLSFELGEVGWIQSYGEVGEKISCVKVDLSEVGDRELSEILAVEGTKHQSSLNLAAPPLLRFVWFDLGKERTGRLLAIIHHLLMDGVSWRIWLEDFRTAYTQLQQRNAGFELPKKTTSFKYWAQKLTDYAQSDTLVQELDYWLAQRQPFPSSLPQTPSTDLNSVVSTETVTVFLETTETQVALHKVSRLHHTQMNELLLCGLLQTCQRWTGENHLLVELEGHGREDMFEDVDISRSLGWFTTRFPLLLSCEASVSPSQALQVVKETLRQIPNRGIGYGVLRYLSQRPEIREKLSRLPQAEVCFNYVGQFTQENSIFPLSMENRGREKSGIGKHTPSITIDAMVIEGRTRLEWNYNPDLYQRETIETLADDFIKSLKTLINECLESERSYAPSDFPLANLTQSQLDSISQEFSNIADIYPLSPLQQGLLFHSLYSAESNLYCQQKVFTLAASLNQVAFRQAWEIVINRHDSLKTAFIWEKLATPLQVVRSAIALPWREENWCHLSSPQQEEELANYLKNDLEQGFSLSNAPLMRMALFQVSKAQYYLVWSHHHLLLDGWCNGIIMQEVFKVYQTLCDGKEPNLPPSPPYKNYIAWLNQKNEVAAQNFWKQALKGVKAPTKWGIEQTVRALNGDRREYCQEELQLSAETTTNLNTWAKSHHLTINSLIQGSFALLLSRYSGEDDVIFGTTVSGRPPELSGVESMVGLLINTVPVRIIVDPDASLLDWLQQLQQQQIERLEYQYNSLVQIQQWSDVAQGNQLFESFIAVENYPIPISLGEGKLKILEVRSFSRTNYPLSVTVELDSSLLVVMTYDPELFKVMAIRQLLQQLQNLMENLSHYASDRLSQIPLTSTQETRKLLDSFNAELD